ncbi:YeeE/YedE family protein [Oceanisphaera avium]|uniref:Sulphur transport domain-containing protein n=1 Tax=Oceanisphaera avium TaxID=1903694 RepID=A0A1Y0CW04_9GAMM|nr:YeeE/YedE family protein [Oceanisphaera avium]ART79530.1 hypothetical protein CBP12_04675 [Oceanisphaera avium]
MNIVNFTPGSALLGGACIGAGALLLLLVGGKIAGISGIVAGLGEPRERQWRGAFVLGLVGVPALLFLSGSVNAPSLASISSVKLMMGGLLVGLGTRLGSGCTSGHGICGIGRLSWRSLIATVWFMSVAMLVVSVFGDK